MKKSIGLRIFCVWLPFAALATIACWLAYFLVQQDIRISANYPQSYMAEDAASTSIFSQNSVNISASQAPFISTFDENGKLVQSDAVLDGSTPVPPAGVFDDARANGEDRFTWQPQTNVRSAAVLVYHPGNPGFFALSGRSLRDVEILEGRLSADTFFAWILSLIVLFVVSIITAHILSEKKPEEKSVEKPIPQPTAQTPSNPVLPS